MESKEQAEAVRWFREMYPEDAKSIRLSLNGLNFGSGARAAKMINYIKAQGAVIGESDLAILIPKGGFGCLLIEHKGAGMAHKLSEKQKAYADYHNSIGNCAVSTRGEGALKAAITAYMGAE